MVRSIRQEPCRACRLDAGRCPCCQPYCTRRRFQCLSGPEPVWSRSALMEQVTLASRPRHFIWNTDETRPAEQFSYYREAICQAFMNLTPESATTSRFPARVESIRL